MKHTRILKIAAMLFAGFGSCFSAQADDVSDFYEGKTINIIVPAGPASGYDIYARLMSEHFSKHMPGNPTVIVQNMPGAGGVKAARYFSSVGKKDGTELLLAPQTIGTDKALGLLGKGVDVAAMQWIGRFTTNVPVGVVSAKAGVTTAQQLKEQEIVFAGTSARSPTIVYPTALNAFGATKMKIVSGFDDTRQTFLAMMQGEVDGLVAGWAGLKASNKDLLDKGELLVLFQGTGTSHPDLTDVPTIVELAEGTENKAASRFIASSSEVGRSIAAHPDVPRDRIDALRTAFTTMLADPDFLGDASSRNIELVASSGHEELEAVIAQTLDVDDTLIGVVKQTLGLK